jgi:hypothetical protein
MSLEVVRIPLAYLVRLALQLWFTAPETGLPLDSHKAMEKKLKL